MTMRQVYGLLKIINRADLVAFYTQTLSYGTVHGVKMPSLEEFLNLSSNDKENVKSFDDKTDKFLEEQALKKLQEKRVKNGR